MPPRTAKLKWNSVIHGGTTFLCVLFLQSMATAQTITDDFSSGNDSLWTRYDPLTSPLVNNPPSTWTVSSGAYRIQAAISSVAPGLVGPGRAGSFRNQFTYGNQFYVASDIVRWDNNNLNLNQAFGLGARITTPGLQTTKGYIFVYFPGVTTPGFQILRLDNETPALVSPTSQVAITLNSSHQYRFEFSGNGSTLTASAYDLTAAPGTPLFTISGIDGTYPSGVSGLTSVSNSGFATTGQQPSDATFDNYYSALVSPVPEPNSMALAGLTMFGVWLWRRRRLC